jgi:NAD(P)-dependent dehydrogenase (short-subunit alcohol dehydrogenase family)
MTGSVVVVGGTQGLGREVAGAYAAQGRPVVLTGRDPARAAAVAVELGPTVRGLGLDLTRPAELAGALAAGLAGVDTVDHLVLSAIARDENSVADYDLAAALSLVSLKLVGYTEVVHALLPRLGPDSSVVLFGGQALHRPYKGSVTVSTVNGGVVGMVHALAVEIAPRRVNGLHPGIVGDSPYWSTRPAAVLDAITARTPIGRLATMADVVGAVRFLLENRSVNGVNLAVDGGWLLL